MVKVLAPGEMHVGIFELYYMWIWLITSSGISQSAFLSVLRRQKVIKKKGERQEKRQKDEDKDGKKMEMKKVM